MDHIKICDEMQGRRNEEENRLDGHVSAIYVIHQIRFFLGDTLGSYYLIIGLGVLLISVYLAFSKYGNIVLGEPDEKPKYSFFVWGSMMFTCGLAADILFYSFAEWIMYATNPHIADLGPVHEWAGVFPLFHWSFIPWAFYLVLAVAFGFMLHVRKRKRQRYSEACRPVIGKHADGLLGRVIDMFALFALLAGTATTFSVATPLLAGIAMRLFHIHVSRTVVTIIILLITCAVYTYAVLHGFKGISFLAKLCIYLFFGLLVVVLVFGGQGRFIIENGIQSLGTELHWISDLHRPCQGKSFSTGLDHLLLGILDGMVCCCSVFYWQYFKGKNDKTDNTWRIRFWCWLNNCKLYRAGQLFSGIAGSRKSRFYCSL